MKQVYFDSTLLSILIGETYLFSIVFLFDVDIVISIWYYLNVLTKRTGRPEGLTEGR